MILRKGWHDGNIVAERLEQCRYDPCRRVLSQGLYNRLRTQLELMMRFDGTRNLMDSFTVEAIRYAGLESSGQYLVVHLELECSAKDVTVGINAEAGQVDAAIAKARKETFYEIYSFVRRRGVKAREGKGLVFGTCPNCGAAATEQAMVNKCAHCGSIYNSGDYDWVLSEITQTCEWKPRSAVRATSQDALPSGCHQLVEDRAACLFWRWIFCRATGNAQTLRRDASPAFLKSFNPRPESLSTPVLGAADLLKIAADKGMLRAQVRCRWSWSPANGQWRNKSSVLEMVSVAGASPNGFAGYSCPACGAPLPETDAGLCEFCGAEIPGTADDWLLDKAGGAEER
jgi:hypothetical protein